MKPKMQITGMTAVRAELRVVAEKVPEAARKTMHRQAAKIVDIAKQMTPVLTGNLEDSIRIIKDYAGIRGRLQIDIGVDPQGEIMGYNGPMTREAFDRYAVYVHEHYEDMQPGPRTRNKVSSYRIGSHFITRAVAEVAPKLPEDIYSAVTQVIQEVQQQ